MSNITAPALGRGASARPATALPTRERRPWWVALAVLLVVCLGATFGALYQRAGAKAQVIVVVARVPAGHVLTRGDVSTTRVAGAVSAMAGGDLSAVVGQRTTVTLLAGTLLQGSMLSSAGEVLPGQAQVGVAVAAGQIPADGVDAGDTVEVLRVPSNGASADPDSAQAEVLVAAATVWSSRVDPSRPGAALLTLTVPLSNVTDIATASAAGAVAVVRVPPGS